MTPDLTCGCRETCACARSCIPALCFHHHHPHPTPPRPNHPPTRTQSDLRQLSFFWLPGNMRLCQELHHAGYLPDQAGHERHQAAAMSPSFTCGCQNTRTCCRETCACASSCAALAVCQTNQEHKTTPGCCDAFQSELQLKPELHMWLPGHMWLCQELHSAGGLPDQPGPQPGYKTTPGHCYDSQLQVLSGKLS
jgi:hypothetical protein